MLAATACSPCDSLPLTTWSICGHPRPNDEAIRNKVIDTINFWRSRGYDVAPDALAGLLCDFVDRPSLSFGDYAARSELLWGSEIRIATQGADEATVLGALAHEVSHAILGAAGVPVDQHHAEFCASGFEPVWC